MTQSKNIQRDSYVWNFAGSIMFSFQQVILLMVLTRVTSLADAGIFTIAFTNATLFLNIGKYGMRIFQVSDAKPQFSFEEYFASRQITVMLMLIACVIYDIFATISNQYGIEKSLIIFLMCVFKAADAVEDVYMGFYQQQNRLDVGAKITTVRTAVTTLFFSLCLIVFHNLLLSLILSIVLTYPLLFVMVKTGNSLFVEKTSLSKGFAIRSRSAAFSLLRNCFPVFASSFFSYYIGNAPKYAIDSLLNDEIQACYGFISLPVSVVGLLSNFIFYPVLYTMTQLWNTGRIDKFLRRFLMQAGVVASITAGCFIVCFFFGIPVLSFIYHTNLTLYKKELLILMVGGGFLAFAWLLGYVITIIRYQKCALLAYACVALLALIMSRPIVRSYGIRGASLLYTVLMGILCILLAVIFAAGVFWKKR